ncbi:hypothetical protein BKA58DRAFT_440295 [Alternaria rosae]|uniref:uncharacterized protein n=1 Tax=Alternaria rosae TaxID=1187941 RepID=UPI001E8E2E23|nr:uncharacterized protein BKA58DRAFT_440295 [Alternaria rosae]KAH6870753.1 hypothetical protein BKA58DRAFT_440295 [Alternaria rosae]
MRICRKISAASGLGLSKLRSQVFTVRFPPNRASSSREASFHYPYTIPSAIAFLLSIFLLSFNAPITPITANRQNAVHRHMGFTHALFNGAAFATKEITVN